MDMSHQRLPSAAPNATQGSPASAVGRRRMDRISDVLATLSLLSVLAAVLLSGLTIGVTGDFVSRNKQWAERRSVLTDLQRAATFMIAPGNDVLRTGDVPAARATRDRALAEVDDSIARFAADLRAAVPASQTDQLANAFDLLRSERDTLVATSDRVFAAVAAGETDEARRAMVEMDQRLFELTAIFSEFNRIFDSIESSEFAAQQRDIRLIERLKYVAAAVVVLLTAGVFVYGIRLRRSARAAETSENQQRAQAEAVRQAAAEDVRLSEERFSRLFYASPFSVIVADFPGGRIVNVNDAFLRIFGFTREEVIGKTTTDIDLWVEPRDRQEFVRLMRAGKPIRDLECAFRTKSGDVRILLMSVEVLQIDGRMHSLAMSIDITERKRIERGMQTLSTDLIAIQDPAYAEAAARHLATLLEAETAFIVRLDPADPAASPSLTLIESGAAVLADAGPKPATLLADAAAGRSAAVLRGAYRDHPEDPFFRQRQVEAYLSEPLFDHAGRPLGSLGVMSRRPLRHGMALPTIMRMFGVAVMAALVREQVHQRDIWLRAILDNAPIEIVLKDQDLRLLAASRNVATERGATSETVVGKRTRDLLPPDIAAVYEAADRSVMESGKPVEQEVRELENGRIRYTHNVKFPLRDETGRVIGIGSLSSDITERKRIEEQLRQATKMEAIGKLTGGMAHDFNNYLAVIIGNLDLLKESAIADPAAQQLIDGALSGALRGAELTESLLAFSRRQPLDPELTDVNRRLAAIATLLRRTLGADIALTTDLAPDLWPVLVDGPQLDAGIVNLANNARDAMPRGGAMSIATRNASLGEADLPENADVPPGDYVLIEMADTGTGMSADTLARAFEPFFSTKGPGHGTGLGLSMLYGFVKQSGGQVRILSELGRGTTVRIYLPRAEAGNARAPGDAEAENRPQLPRGTETILVVEDNDDVRSTTVAQLTSLGYRVTAVQSGDAALAILDREDRQFDLLFSDIVMPGVLDGYDLARFVLERRPGMKILLTSGFSGDKLRQQDGGAPQFNLLGKPFRREELARSIRAALESGAPAAA